MKVRIETERLILRSFVPSDLVELHKLHSSPEVMQYLVGGVRLSLSETKLDLDKYISHEHLFGFGKWATVLKSSGELIGRSGLVNIPETHEIDLGYAISKEHWGVGYATEIAFALRKFAQEKIRDSKVIGLVKDENLASVKVLKRIGLSLRGNGKYFGETFQVYESID